MVRCTLALKVAHTLYSSIIHEPGRVLFALDNLAATFKLLEE